MDDSINEYAKKLIARAKAREEGILRRQDNRSTVTPVASSVSTKFMLTTTSSAAKGDSALETVPTNDVVAPATIMSPRSNKENLERKKVEQEYEDEDEDMDDEEEGNQDQDEVDHDQDQRDDQDQGDQENDEDNESHGEEHADELLPLNLLASKPLARTFPVTSGPQSASPISRKTRLSALAQSINSWEDDDTPPSKKGLTAAAVGVAGTFKDKGPRYSVATPPQTNRSTLNASKRQSCHQFVATPNSESPLIKSPVKGTPITIGTVGTELSSWENSFASPSSTEKQSMNPSPMKSLSSLHNSPTKAMISPKKVTGSPAKAIVSPKKITSSPVKIVKFEVKEEEKQIAHASPIRQKASSPLKQVVADDEHGPADAVMRNLESQGFVKVDQSQGGPKISDSILSRRRVFEKDVDTVIPEPAPKLSKHSVAVWPTVAASSSAHPTTAHVPISSQSQTALQQFHSRKSLQVDPSELSVAQKARLFERQQKEQDQLKTKEMETNQWLNKGRTKNAVSSNIAPKVQEAISSPTKSIPAPAELQVKNQRSDEKPQYYFGQQIDSTIPPPPPPLPPTSFSPNKVSPSKPVVTEDQDEEMESNSEDEQGSNNCSPSMLIAQSVKPIKRVVTKIDKMYPSLTDIENNTETEDNETNTSSVESSPVASCSFNSSMSTSSLGSFIQTKAQSRTMNSEINTTMACQQIDDLIDEALEGQTVDDTFMMEGAVPLQTSSPIVKHIPQPLMHSVSVYRKNQQQYKKAEEDSDPFKVPPSLGALEEENENDIEALQNRIQTLEQLVLIQQKAIAQSSKALNVCESSFEFNNSTENIEGERVLLIATQKRCQLLSFISKLRNGSKGSTVSPSKDNFRPSSSTRGTMNIDSIQLYPVKSARLHQDYVYHFIAILKYNEQVFATATVKTSASNTSIDFPNEFVLPELDPGFKVQVEVYALRTFKQMDVIPHNMKYHIKNPSTPQSGTSSTPSKGSTFSQFLTPTRSSKNTPKATDLRSTPGHGAAMSSSNSIRTSNFTLQAVLNLNLSNLNKTEWEMSMVNSSLILPNISMRIKCANKNELEFHGFLTVFSDVSGLGAWHRRWAMLDQDFRLLFWTYPEDEAQKPPVLSIELQSCITPRISPAPRDVCARPNTFLLVTTREPLPTDKDSLVVSVHEKYTAIKNLFSADNRSERDAWIAVINKALTNMRAWGHQIQH